MGTFPDHAHELNGYTPAEFLVAKKLRELRTLNGFSLRVLAERSGLNVNTLSLIENGKTSPSVSTLQQLAQAFKVPIASFFESEIVEKQVIYTAADKRPNAAFNGTQMQNLGKDLTGNAVQPFVVTLEPGKGSGSQIIVHTGHEFVYCLGGIVHYQVEQTEFDIKPGDSLLFEAHLPHCWENQGEETAQILLVLFPSDAREEPGCRHFSHNTKNKDLNMKLAVITEDGKTISQHFGRAPHYLVLTIEEGKITSREMREKLGHNQFGSQPHGEDQNGAEHGCGTASHKKHVSMAQAISDCKVLLCGGMGMGAYESMRQLDIQPVVTNLQDIDAAVQSFIDGKLIDHTELLH